MATFLKKTVLCLLLSTSLINGMLILEQFQAMFTKSKPQKPIEFLYENTASTIAKVDTKEDQSIYNLMQLMNSIKVFKEENSGINEHELGCFAYAKKEQKPFWWWSKTATPLQVALFFRSLKEYYENINKIHKTHPTLEDWLSHQHNESLQTEKTLEMGKNIGITISYASIDFNKQPFKPINPHAAIELFKRFVAHIEILISTKAGNLQLLQHLAALTYLNQAETAVNITAPTGQE